MPRPNKLKVPTSSYNLILPTTWKEYLSKESFVQSKIHNKEISIADLIRDAISEKLNGQEGLKLAHKEKNES